jgi:hypothetical protein
VFQDVSEIKIAFGIPPERPTLNFAASWNVAPTDPLRWRAMTRRIISAASR